MVILVAQKYNTAPKSHKHKKQGKKGTVLLM